MLNWTPQTAPSSGEPTCERQSRSAAVRGIREIRATSHPVVQTPQGISLHLCEACLLPLPL